MKAILCAGALLGFALMAHAGAQTFAPVTDINPGSAGSYPSYLTVFDDALYFGANDSPHGTNVEFWRFDGATANVAADIRPGPEGSLPSHLTAHEGLPMAFAH